MSFLAATGDEEMMSTLPAFSSSQLLQQVTWHKESST